MYTVSFAFTLPPHRQFTYIYIYSIRILVICIARVNTCMYIYRPEWHHVIGLPFSRATNLENTLCFVPGNSTARDLVGCEEGGGGDRNW